MKKITVSINRFMIVLLVMLALYLTSLYSFLLFHSLTEVFTVIVTSSIFILAWNTRRWMEDDFFLFIGIAFLFVSILDLLHALSYRGMNIFQGYDANLPTQLWILARYIQSISLLIAPIWLRKRLSKELALAAYFCVTSISLGLIFTNNFPTSYVEDVGLTNFKIISEYVIILILAASVVPLILNRARFEQNVLRALILFLILSMGAEFAFTTYLGVYDGTNLVGHLIRLISYFFIYSALLKTGMQYPFDLVFRNLKLKEGALQQSEADLQKLFDISPFPVVIARIADARLIKVNQATLDIFELLPEDLDEYTDLDLYTDPNDRTKLLDKLSQQEKIKNESLELKTKSGKTLWCLIDATSIDFEGEACLLLGMADITEQKRIQDELQFLSMHDALTGVYNRTYFEAEMKRLQNGRQYPVSIIMLDTDDLKMVNDTHGHAEGDKMLQTVAFAITEILRADEVFARIGGDEFAILLPHADEVTSRLVITRIKDQLQKHSKKNGNRKIKVSIGLGVAGVKDDLIEAFMQADANMYANKYYRKGDTKPLKPLGEERENKR